MAQKVPRSGLQADNPAGALIDALMSHSNISSAAGAGTGLTIVCADLVNYPNFQYQAIKVKDGPASGQARFIVADTTGGTITVNRPFTNPAGAPQAILAGVNFDILGTVGDAGEILTIMSGGTGLLFEQADTPVNITATNAAETDVLNMAVADTRYLVRHLRLKCADPGQNTVTVRLYELVNDAFIVVDTFAITNANFATYFHLVDMFGIPHLAGDRLQVTVRADAGGPYAVTGQYSHAKTNA